MSKDKNKKHVDETVENPELVQTEAAPGADQKAETQEVETKPDSAAVQQTDGGQPEGETPAKLDSENKAETVGKEGGEAGGAGVTDADLERMNQRANEKPLTKEDLLKLAEQFDNQVREPESTTKKRDKIAAEVFAGSTRTVLYFTSDLVPFASENDAIKHARTLKDQNIVTKHKE